MQFRGWRVHVERFDGPGDVPPMVLLHGFASGSFTWRPAIEAGLAEGRRAIAFDRFGFGKTERPRRGTWSDRDGDANPYSLTTAIDLTASIVDELRTTSERVVLVGHSAGALVASGFAATAPTDRIAGLVLVAPVIGEGGPPPMVAAAFRLPMADRWAPAALRAGRGLTQRAVAAAWHDRAGLQRSGLGTDYAASTNEPDWAEGLVELTLVTTATAAAGTFDADATLATIRGHRIPTLVVAGAHDRLANANATRRIADLTGGELHTVEHAGHVPHEERPKEFVEAVKRFLSP